MTYKEAFDLAVVGIVAGNKEIVEEVARRPGTATFAICHMAASLAVATHRFGARQTADALGALAERIEKLEGATDGD